MLEAILTRDQLADQIIRRIMSGEKTLSYSSISAFKKSPATFIDYQLGIKEETDAMIYGSMVHCMILEPELFDSRYLVLDDQIITMQIGGAKPRATKVYKEWLESVRNGAGNRIIVDADDYKDAYEAARNARSNRASRKVLDACPITEKRLDWEYMNFKFKGFKDGDGLNDTFDIKTCVDAHPEKFQREIINRGYYLQGAMYLQAEGPRNYHMIAIDRKGGISVHKLHPRLIEYGLNEYHRLMSKFNECILRESFNENYDFWSPRMDGAYIMDKPSFLNKYE